MTPLSRRLPRFFRRLDDLGKIISDVDATDKRTILHVYCAEKALIQIQIEWEQFVRNLILDSATGNFSNSSGRVWSQKFSQIRSREVAAYILVSTYPQRNIEPDWCLPVQAIQAAQNLDISNFAQISAELGATPWPIDELRHVRNFIAHKSKRSALSLRQTAIVPHSDKIDVLNAAFQYVSGGSKRYENWITFAKGVAKRMTT